MIGLPYKLILVVGGGNGRIAVTWQNNLGWTTSNAGRGTTLMANIYFTQVQLELQDANGTATATGFDGALLTITPAPVYTFLVQLTTH
ncbi:MAG: hypothetical protein IPO26_10510 [Saprospiraceae bacterium]|nr:hypothetical protein [Saprospiraceae bacterium]